MSYVFEKHFVERYEITNIKRRFMKYHVFNRTRNDKPCCELCDKVFERDDNTNLAFAINTTNKLVCDNCATDLISKGVKEIHWGTNS